MQHCPTTEILAAYQAGFVSIRTRAKLDQHLAACARCRQELTALQQTVHAISQLSPPAIPQDLWPGVAQRLVTRRRHSTTRVWGMATTAGVIASIFVGWLTLRSNHAELLPIAPPIATQHVRSHQLLSTHDALIDRASLGVALASYGKESQ